MPNTAVTSAVLLAATSSVPVFAALLPDLATVRKSVGNPDTVNDVRMGEAAATGIVISIGLIASSLTKSPVPAMITIVVSAGLVVMYESVLASTPKEVRK